MDQLPQLLINSLITGSIYALCGAGLSLAYGLLRILNFGHGHLMMLGGYSYYLFSVQLGYGMLLSAIFTAVVALVTSFVTLSVFVWPVLRFNSLLPFVTTLALGAMLEAGISIAFGVNVKSLTSGEVVESLHSETFGIYVTPLQLFIIASALILLSLLAVLIHRTPFGRRVRAISASQYGAEAVGISVRGTTFMVFFIGMLFTFFSGILVGMETNIQPTMGSSYTIKVFAAMVFGGLGNIWGTVLGSYILGLIENLAVGLSFGDFWIPAGYKDAFALCILLIMLIFRPEGLLGKKQRSV